MKAVVIECPNSSQLEWHQIGVKTTIGTSFVDSVADQGACCNRL
jgi:hypothetical protein